MSLAVQCPSCSKKFKVKDEAAGKRVRCPDCSDTFRIPVESDDNEFLSRLDKGVTSQGDSPLEEDDEFTAPSLPKRKNPPAKKKKSFWKKWTSKATVSKGTATGTGLVFLCLVVFRLLIGIGQGKFGFDVTDFFATWSTFKHPTSVAAIDMPGTPTLDAKQSINGVQSFSLTTTKYKMTLLVVSLPVEPLAINPAGIDLFFNQLESATLSQSPGAKKISSRMLSSGSIPGMEMKVESNGEIILTKCFLFSNNLAVAEYTTRNETVYGSQRERFFSSLRGPDGNLLQVTTKSSTMPNSGGAGSPTAKTEMATQASTLAEARRKVQTRLVRQVKDTSRVAVPPDSLARIVHYDAPGGKLAAYLTTVPQDGERHPAIIWVSGGFSNSIDNGYFENASVDNDQTASAFWKSGIVTMYPSLRGGNDNPGFNESFFGEVDDVLSALEFLSKQDGIDPNRIYLGGHSTGGTVALLAAEMTDRFRAVFSFGPVDDIRGYGLEYVYFDAKNAAELEVRNPTRWINTIQDRTFVIEGSQGNAGPLSLLSKASQNPNVTFLLVPGMNHFSILAPSTKLIATKILQDVGPKTSINLMPAEIIQSLNSIKGDSAPGTMTVKRSGAGKNKTPMAAGTSSRPSTRLPAESMNGKSPIGGDEEKPVLSDLAGDIEGGFPFQRVLRGKPMIGVDWGPGQWAGTIAIGGLYPVSENDPPKPFLQRVKAPKGYAVGGIKVYAPLYVTSIQLVYMKLRSDGTLDPDEPKLSEWIGGKPKGEITEFMGDGKNVVGLHGRAGAVINSIGVMLKP